MLETVLCNIRTIAAFYEIALAQDGTYDCDNAFIYNPQSPRGPRRILPGINRSNQNISIHKALAGLDHLHLNLC